MENETIIEFINITKEFPGIKANDHINIAIKKGTIHALVGENGAGKSTLMSILFGIYKPTSGIIKINGSPIIMKDPNQANDIGIGMVHQHFKLVMNYSNFENIILGSEFEKNGFLDRTKSLIKIQLLQEKFGLKFDLNQKTNDATIVTQQKIEIIKMLYRDADILIFDEPTAVLAPKEIVEFLAVLKFLKNNGKTILFISHKLWEVMEVSDEITVIRHGRVIKHYDSTNNVTTAELADAMVGKHLVYSKNLDHTFSNDCILKLDNISINKKVKNLNLEVHAGEILAIAGVEGNGQEELEYILSGVKKPIKGRILLKLRPNLQEKSKNYNIEYNQLELINNRNFYMTDITNFSSKNKNKSKISVIPGDRHKHGLVLDFDINDNAILRSLYDKKFSKFSIINNKQKNIFSKKIIDLYDVRGSREGNAIARSLSGGNQQKAIVGRELLTDHDLIVIVQPTRGLDIGAINMIHEEIIKEKEKGKAILLISYELDEIISLADTIAVINKGKIVGIKPAKHFDRKEIGLLMAGLDHTGELYEK